MTRQQIWKHRNSTQAEKMDSQTQAELLDNPNQQTMTTKPTTEAETLRTMKPDPPMTKHTPKSLQPTRPDPPAHNRLTTDADKTTTDVQTTKSPTNPPKKTEEKTTTMKNTNPRQGSMLATELWCLGHAGPKKLQATAKCAKGMHNIGNLHPSFKCGTCATAKLTKSPKRKTKTQATIAGERFHMDFGFVRGLKHLQSLLHERQTPKHKIQNAESHHPMKTSHDGHSSYPLIMDAASRHTWTFLAKTKEPPLMTLNTFLSQNGLKKDQPKCVRTDQGGELARSAAF